MSTIIKHKEFPKFKSWTMDLCGRPLTIEVGKVAELASASAMVKYGETTVMVAVTVSPRPRDGVDFFPLSVDFEEKLYAVGRIPGSFMRREGRPSLPAVLASRLIDRPMRPLFPYDFRNDVCIQCTVMSVDYDCSPEVAAMIGASACVSYSEIPFAGPIGCLEVGYVDGQIVLNPNQEQRKTSRMDVTVAATAEKVVMIEAGADEIPDEIMYAGIVKAHEWPSSTRSLPRSARPRWSMSTLSSTRSCSTRSWPTSWTRPRPPWIPTTRMSGRPAGTP